MKSYGPVLMPETDDRRMSDKWTNLAEERFGAEVLFATDDFFAEKENLIKPGRGVFYPDRYTENGKWMDGWESRRRRSEGHDFAIVQLGLTGQIRGLDIDTNFFTGNFPEFASLEACYLAEGNPDNQTEWVELLGKSPLRGSAQNFFEITNEEIWSHVRLHIYPDGGVARLRVYGQVQVNWTDKKQNDVVDLLAVENGGRALACNDMHYGHIRNLIAPGRGVNMGDGWETRRRRVPGHDWATLALGHRGCIQKVIVDTAHFKGNYPGYCSIDATDHDNDDLAAAQWKELLPKLALSADTIHEFENEVADIGAITHLRLKIYPDGGVSRLRAIGVRV